MFLVSMVSLVFLVSLYLTYVSGVPSVCIDTPCRDRKPVTLETARNTEDAPGHHAETHAQGSQKYYIEDTGDRVHQGHQEHPTWDTRNTRDIRPRTPETLETSLATH